MKLLFRVDRREREKQLQSRVVSLFLLWGNGKQNVPKNDSLNNRCWDYTTKREEKNRASRNDGRKWDNENVCYLLIYLKAEKKREFWLIENVWNRTRYFRWLILKGEISSWLVVLTDHFLEEDLSINVSILSDSFFFPWSNIIVNKKKSRDVRFFCLFFLLTTN